MKRFSSVAACILADGILMAAGCSTKPHVPALPASDVSAAVPSDPLGSLAATVQAQLRTYAADYELMLREMNRSCWAACYQQDPQAVADALQAQKVRVESGMIGGPHSEPTFTLEANLGTWRSPSGAEHDLRLLLFCGGSELDHTRSPREFDDAVRVRGAWVFLEREWNRPLSGGRGGPSLSARLGA